LDRRGGRQSHRCRKLAPIGVDGIDAGGHALGQPGMAAIGADIEDAFLRKVHPGVEGAHSASLARVLDRDPLKAGGARRDVADAAPVIQPLDNAERIDGSLGRGMGQP